MTFKEAKAARGHVQSTNSVLVTVLNYVGEQANSVVDASHVVATHVQANFNVHKFYHQEMVATAEEQVFQRLARKNLIEV
jgi:hypothetical protein